MANEVKQVKDLGWTYISLTKTDFKGAVQEYDRENGGKVAVCFNLHEAFIVEDELGLFGVEDLKQGIIRDKSIDIEATGQIEGVTTIGWEDEGEFGFNEEKLTSLGINAFEVKESIKNRLFHLAQMDQLVDASERQ